MDTARKTFAANALSVAVRGALAAMLTVPVAAFAADPAVEALTLPTNTVEIGVIGTSKDSAKFGEYNGLDQSGAKLLGHISLRGGDAYGGPDAEGGGTTRWSLTGSDLGTTSRSLGATYGSQGRWHIGVGFDELTHHLSDSYQTHLQGRLGGNVFTAPPTFGTVNGAPTPANTPVTLNATQLAAFHGENVSTTRKNTSFNAGLRIDPRLSLQFDFNHLDQSGAKLLGSGALGGVTTPLGGTTWRAEAIALILNPTQYKTDNFNLALNWVGDGSHLTASYFGSIFSDAYNSVSWENVQQNNGTNLCPSGGSCAYQTNTMSTAPGNRFHQLNLSGGHVFSRDTRLTGGLSYGRNTQNQSFLTGLPEIVASPAASLDGLVITRHADLKLTHNAGRALTLSAGLKYNERDNRSASNNYSFWAINSVLASATNLVDVAANAPYSHRKSELELAGDYRIDARQSLRGAVEHVAINRWCTDMANGFDNCVVSPSSKEDTLGLKYRLKANESVGFNVGYAHAYRKARFDHDAVTPLSGLDKVGTPDDVNAQDYPGFIAYVYGTRKQDTVKAGVIWQATESVELGLNGRYVDTRYPESTLGVQNSRTTGLNLDATYSYGEANSLSGYISVQNSDRLLRSGGAGAGAVNTAASAALLVAPTNIWTNGLADKGQAIGIASKHSGLMGGRLDVVGDLSYALDTSGYRTAVPYVLATCSATNNVSCGVLPDISNQVVTLKLTGSYQLDERSRVALGFIHQQRKTDDYHFNTASYGFTPNRVMPTNEQAPNHSVNVLAVSYVLTFR